MTKRGKQDKHGFSPAAIGRWVLGLCLIGGLLAGVGWSFVWVLTPDNVPLKQVQIEGDIRHTGRERIKRAMAPTLQGGFFSLDLEAVRSAVENLPWVTRASVRRVWPHSLVVRVHEREALAHWGDKGVVSPEGEVFTPAGDSVPQGLARLTGPVGSAPDMVRRYQWILGRLETKGLDIERLSMSERGAWILQVRQGPLLHLGNRNLERRLERFLSRHADLVSHGQAQQVDLRYTGGFAVRWTEQPAEGMGHTGAEG